MMDTNNLIPIPGFSSLPPSWQMHLVQGFVISLIIGRVVQAIRTGGGLKAILGSIWLGSNKPKDKPQ